MSRVGQKPVVVPEGVDVRVVGLTVTAKGKLGERSITVTDDVTVKLEDGQVWVAPVGGGKRARTMWGTTRSLIDGLVKGVDEGFTRILDINGVGYRAAVDGKTLNLQLGYSHPVNFPIPEGIKIVTERNVITISGNDKQAVGQVSAKIRSFRPPEPYKGKGVKYRDEVIHRKEGKKK
jgi:large subunit ribosomal protein L6